MNLLVVIGDSCYNREMKSAGDFILEGAFHMTRKERAVQLLKKYKHGWVFSYLFVYLIWFFYLEKHVTKNYLEIHSAIDDRIPFIEYFIIPYLSWFLFIAIVFLYFFFTDVEGFYRLARLTFAGMTIFLIISTLIPNGVHLRPVVFERDNVFVDMVRMLYWADTPTNVMPSIHVYNSLAACIAICHSRKLQEHKAVCYAAYFIAALIILSTMFLKQHSVVDVSTAFVMAYTLYFVFYVPEGHRYVKERRIKTALISGK